MSLQLAETEREGGIAPHINPFNLQCCGSALVPDLAVYLIEDSDPDTDPGSQTNADLDPDPCQSQKVEFLH